VAQWKENHFRICIDAFPIGTILSVVDFSYNYMLQFLNEIQSQYYHSEKVIIMAHITYRHGADNNEENIVILKEYHFYIRDDQFHDLGYI
jgi:hypothetical protein